MEPTTENRPTVTATAEAVGAKRLEKVTKWVNRLAGSDVYLKVGINAAKDKVEFARQRVEEKATEIRNRVAEKISDAYGRFETRFNAAKDKTVALGKQIGRRAAVIGLTPVALGESALAEIYKIPAGIRESIASAQDRRIEEYQAKIKELRQSKDSHREKATERRNKAANMNSVRRALDRVSTSA